ncbi:MAG: hypothetical protein Q4C41_08005 [Eggerthellaceae bacterium]|nr:hypothetical protein [Eggerthellaceae bacterium]
MKIEKLNPDIYDPDYKEDILNTDFSKKGLSEFHRKHPDKYLCVVLSSTRSIAKDVETAFDAEGTFPLDWDPLSVYYDPTGAFSFAYDDDIEENIITPGRPDEAIIEVYAGVSNVFDYINFFENELDVTRLREKDLEDEQG